MSTPTDVQEHQGFSPHVNAYETIWLVHRPRRVVVTAMP